MDAVGDEIGKQPILGELGEDGVVELVHGLRHAIAEMRREGKPGLYRLSKHLSFRGAVAHRDDLAARLRPADELERPLDLGRERDEKDRPPKPRLQPLDKGRIGGRHRLMRVTPAITFGGIQERPFEMISRAHAGAEAARLNSAVERLEAGLERIGKRGDQGREATRDAG